jgi:hypothetical protein
LIDFDFCIIDLLLNQFFREFYFSQSLTSILEFFLHNFFGHDIIIFILTRGFKGINYLHIILNIIVITIAVIIAWVICWFSLFFLSIVLFIVQMIDDIIEFLDCIFLLELGNIFFQDIIWKLLYFLSFLSFELD